MRHGEKPSGGYGQLTCQGLNRSLALPDVLLAKFGKPTYLYAPNPAVRIVDVDSDPELQRQFGLKVPVLLLDGSVVCHYTLNSKELLRLVGRPAAILPR